MARSDERRRGLKTGHERASLVGVGKPTNTDSITTIEVETFLEELAEGSFEERRRGQTVVVAGSVNLCRHPLRTKIASLPGATITGDLIADYGCALRTCRARISGMVSLDGSHIEELSPEPGTVEGTRMGVGGKVSAKGCAGLRKISGAFDSDVSLDGSGIEEIGSDFLCEGVLSVEGCGSLRSLDCCAVSVIADGSALEETGPNAAIENLSAEGCLNLTKATPIRGLKWAKYDGSGIEEVHPRFLCKGPVYFKRCRRLTSLAGEAGSIEVSMAPLKRIGNLAAGRGMIFTDCRNLPTGMGGLRSKTLVFARCDLEELPAGIQPDTDVRIGQCPDFSTLPTQWRGDISLTELPSLRETPEGFKCMGKFDVEWCENLTRVSGFVGGDLHLMSKLPQLTRLDDDLEVGGDLWVSPHAGLLSVGCKIRGSLTAKAGPLRETSDKLEVGGNGDFHGSPELRILRGKFGGKVILDETTVEALGADIEIGGDLSMRKTPNLTSLNCSVGGHVIVKNSGLRRTGPAFRCGKGLEVRNCPNFDTLQGEVKGVQRISRQKRSTENSEGEARGTTAKPLRARTVDESRPPNRVYPNKWFAPGGLNEGR